MNIDYLGRHVDLDERLRAHVEDRLGRIQRLLREPAEAHVTLEAEKHRHMAEIRVREKRGEMLAKEEAADLYLAIDLAADKLEAQARRTRDKQTSKRRRPESAAPAQSDAASGEDSST